MLPFSRRPPRDGVEGERDAREPDVSGAAAGRDPDRRSGAGTQRLM